jgi:hypothetical protein
MKAGRKIADGEFRIGDFGLRMANFGLPIEAQKQLTS